MDMFKLFIKSVATELHSLEPMIKPSTKLLCLYLKYFCLRC